MQTNPVKELTGKQIKSAKRLLPVPFQLKLKDYSAPLIIEKIVRIIPKKRFVAFGTFEGKAIVAKCFLESSKKNKSNHATRDAAGVNILTTANIPTPALLIQTVDQSNRISILIFERIQDAYNLDWLWQQKSDNEELAPLMRAVTIELATQHVLGVIQKDLHLKNFLIANKKIYTLDGGSIEQFNEPYPKKESLQHLALFFSQLGVGTDALQKELFDLYTQSRGWLNRPNEITFLQESIKKWRLERSARYMKKILRNCSSFSRIEKFTSLTLYDRDYASESFFELLKNPEAPFTNLNTEFLKKGRSSTVIKIKNGDRTFVIKRYNMKNILHWLRRMFRPSRASRSWQLAHTLTHAGIPTAKPIAFIEKHFFGLRHKSYFIMEYVDGKHIGDYFSRYRAEESAYSLMAKRVINLIDSLSELNLTHGDLKMTNIIISQNRPVLIDLDGMQSHRTTGSLHRAIQKELKRFMENWKSLPTVGTLFNKIIEKTKS